VSVNYKAVFIEGRSILIHAEFQNPALRKAIATLIPDIASSACILGAYVG